LEDPVDGGLVGPTSACLIGAQFQALKYGDRFFYTHADANPDTSLIPPSIIHCL